jgi:hypothetical protein
MPSGHDGLAAPTIRLAASDLLDALPGGARDVGVTMSANDARERLDGVLGAHRLAGPAVPGADHAYRLAVADAAFRPNAAVGGRRDASGVRDQLVELITPAVRGRDPKLAARVVDAIQHAHESGTRSDLPAMIGSDVEPGALMFLTLECSVRGEAEMVGGEMLPALALFDYQETTLSLDALAGVSDPLNWPSCNECFKSIDPVAGSYWETEAAHGIDIVEVFEVPFTEFRTQTALSITYIDTEHVRMMEYDLSTTNAHLGDGQVVVDRGFARIVDLGDRRRFEALKVVRFGDDPMANATSWFSCLWWDLMTVRTALLCPNKQVTPKEDLLADVGARSDGGTPLLGAAGTRSGAPGSSSDAVEPGPLESLVIAASDVMRAGTREWMGIATRTAKRWPPGEVVTDGKITSDLIEGFERLTPVLGRGMDLWLGTAQKSADMWRPPARDQKETS